MARAPNLLQNFPEELLGWMRTFWDASLIRSQITPSGNMSVPCIFFQIFVPIFFLDFLCSPPPKYRDNWKLTTKPRHFWMPNPQPSPKKKDHNCSWRAGKAKEVIFFQRTPKVHIFLGWSPPSGKMMSVPCQIWDIRFLPSSPLFSKQNRTPKKSENTAGTPRDPRLSTPCQILRFFPTRYGQNGAIR